MERMSEDSKKTPEERHEIERGENLMNHDHKGTNEKYRENYDQIRWDINEESKKGPVYGHFA